LNEGFLYVRNPFNAHQISKVNLTPDEIECIVFWTKNPKEFLKRIHIVDELGFKYYFQFTVTSYDSSIEEQVPKKKEIIDTFIELSEKIGSEKVIWRYDPILITEKFNIEYHVKWYDYLASNLKNHTNKCIISFVDMYKKCERNLKEIKVEKVSNENKKNFAQELSRISKLNGLVLETCAEELELQREGISHGKCIDDTLIEQIIDSKISISKDKTQRQACGCVTSIDIGSYNTCMHGCKYCYANFSKHAVEKNCSLHDKLSPLLTGHITGKEKITERKAPKLLKKQQILF
jgi:DNA repair photolyase